MKRVEPAEAWKPFLRKISIELGVDPDYKDPSGRYPPLVEEIWSAPAVVAIWGPRRRAAQPATDTATANVAEDAAAASAGDEDAVATTSREAGLEATNTDEHSAAGSKVGSGLDGAASAALSSPVMPNDPRSPRPTHPTPMGSFDVLSTPRPAAKLAQAVPPSVQTPMLTPNPTASPQQARALTTDSPPASAARLADKQESSAPATPMKNQYVNAESPALTRKRKALHDLVDNYLRATCYSDNSPPPPAAMPGAGLGYRIQRAKLSHQSMQQFLAPLQGILSALPAPVSPAAACNTPDRPASSGASSPPPFHGTRAGRSVDPDQDVTPLELPPAVYSVPFIAPQRIIVESLQECSEKLPLTCPVNDERLAVLRDAQQGGDDENADAGTVADEPVEHEL